MVSFSLFGRRSSVVSFFSRFSVRCFFFPICHMREKGTAPLRTRSRGINFKGRTVRSDRLFADVQGFKGGIPRSGRAPIVRIAEQLGEMGGVITREFELGARNPEGVCDRLGKKRRDLKSIGRFLTNREMYIYVKDCSIAKWRKLAGL